MSAKIKVVYVTSSSHKKKENNALVNSCKLRDGTLVRDIFDFEIREVSIKELLEVDLATMVQAEVVNAYSQLKVPCIVEHAGLIFDEYKAEGYPGGLTKPMWDALGDRFVDETSSAGRRALARAVIAYCDGKAVHTFVGETAGKIADSPRGGRKFYWDTIFVPDSSDPNVTGKTYAEICEDGSLGIPYKMQHLSQSGKAMQEFMEYRRANSILELWS